jgi:hypothetical protein
MFMLNMLFDFNNNIGAFSDLETPGVPLLSSKHWLRIAQPDPNNFDPEAAAWQDLGRVGTLFILHGGAPANRHAVAVRIAPVPGGPAIVANASLDFAAAFGRPVIARQDFASPFVNGAGAAVTLIQQVGVVRPAGVPAWFFRFGRIDRQPNDPNLTHRYEFALGIKVDNQGGVIHSYGEDPEFDIGT